MVPSVMDVRIPDGQFFTISNFEVSKAPDCRVRPRMSRNATFKETDGAKKSHQRGGAYFQELKLNKIEQGKIL